jgi:hypothetical protein
VTRWILALAWVAIATSCRRDEGKRAVPATDPVPVVQGESPSDAPGPDDEEEPELIEQLPLPEAPLAFTTGVGGGLDLEAAGLPAIRSTGDRIARVERDVGEGEQRRLALRVLGIPSGDVVREVVILDPDRDIRRGKLPSQSVLDRRLAAANAVLSAGWISLIDPESVLPDGWIRCREGSQQFEVAGLDVSYAEPTLTIRRGDTTLFERAMPDWVAQGTAATCGSRSFVADAALDLRGDPDGGLLVVDVQYCGHCAVPPRVEVVTWGTSSGTE